jgi:hypothetical protein
MLQALAGHKFQLYLQFGDSSEFLLSLITIFKTNGAETGEICRQ